MTYREVEIADGPSLLCNEVLLAVTDTLASNPPQRYADGGWVWSKEATTKLDKRLRERLLALHASFAADVEAREMFVQLIRAMAARGCTHTEIHVSLSMIKARMAYGYTTLATTEESNPPEPPTG